MIPKRSWWSHAPSPSRATCPTMALSVLLTVVAAAGRGVTRPGPARLGKPLQVVATKADGTRLRGRLLSYDAGGFAFLKDGAVWTTEARRVSWAELRARDVFAIHERLLEEGTGQDWLKTARVLQTLDGGQPFAEAAFKLAAELDPSLKRLIDDLRRRRARSRALGRASVLDQPPPPGPKARRLIKALKQQWDRAQQAGDPTAKAPPEAPKPPATPQRVKLPRPVAVRASTATRKPLAGKAIWYDTRGFELREKDGKNRFVAWGEFGAQTVFNIHETLFGDGTPQQWLGLGRLLWRFPGGMGLADSAFVIAIERDPSLGESQEFNRLHLLAYIKERRGAPVHRPPPSTDSIRYWTRMREQLEKAGQDRKEFYRVVGEALLLADRLFLRGDRKKRLWAVGYCHDATYVAIRRLEDPLLGLAIADVYLLPNLRQADRRPTQLLSRTAILNTAVAAYHKAADRPRLIHALERLLPLARTRAAADSARFRLAYFLADAGEDRKALHYLSQIGLKKGGTRGGAAALKKKLEARLERQRRQQPANPAPDTTGKKGD